MLQKLIRGGQPNLSEWFEKIIDEFCQEQVVEERVSVENIKKRFYIDFTKELVFSLLTLLFRILIDREVGHIFKFCPSLIEPPPNTN